MIGCLTNLVSGTAVTVGTDFTSQEERSSILVEFAHFGYAVSDKDHVAMLVSLTKKDLFPKIKFVTDDSQLNKMAAKLCKMMNCTEAQKKPGSHWMNTWSKLGANACRKAINKKRNDITSEIRKEFASEYSYLLFVFVRVA